MEILRDLPYELKLKVLGYKQSPPHFIAISTGMFPIRDSLLNVKDEWVTLYDSDDDWNELDDEWLQFEMEMELTQSNPHLSYSPLVDYFL